MSFASLATARTLNLITLQERRPQCASVPHGPHSQHVEWVEAVAQKHGRTRNYHSA